jgi:predicted acetyltransferase
VTELVRPTVDLGVSFWELVDSFDGATVHGSGLRPSDLTVLRDPAVFAEWVDWLGEQERADTELSEGRVPSSYRWVVTDGGVVGTVAIRHALTPSLLAEGGHIGYAVGPAHRRRGIASAALALALDHAARRGVDPALVTCDATNVASARTIDRARRERGGWLDDEVDGIRRTWLWTGVAGTQVEHGATDGGCG